MSTAPFSSGPPSTPPTPVDIKAEMRRAAEALHQPLSSGPARGRLGSMTSDLSIDEELLLHAIGWEPVELVAGISLYSVPMGVWNWGQGEISTASDAYARAFAMASKRLHRQGAKAGGHGVVGVQVNRAVHRHHIGVSLLGTAVRPAGAKPIADDEVFISDLSARDFTLLDASGWRALGLAVGASFVYAPRRSIGATLQQKSQNVELTNYTEAMYSSRESAMERMQSAAIAMGGTGVVEVKVTEGPMDFASHAIGFEAWGTVVRLGGDSHRSISPTVVLPLDDATASFDASSLRGS